MQQLADYHATSKHSPERYAPAPTGLDWDNQPDPFRYFHGAPEVELPLSSGADASYAQMRQGTALPWALDRTGLGLLLETSLGLSAWKSYAGNAWALRCTPSGGNLHPTEAYVLCSERPGLPGGVYHYLSLQHVLERRAAPDPAALQATLGDAGFLIGLTSVPWRAAWKYGVRAYRYCQHDLGHAIAALRYSAALVGWRAVLLEEWGDDQVATLLGLDDVRAYADVESEVPGAVLWVSNTASPPGADGLSRLLQTIAWQGRANRLSAEHVEWPQIAAAERAARKPATAPLPPPPCMPLPALAPLRADLAASELLRGRRSAVGFNRHATLPLTSFFHLLDALLPRPASPPWDCLPWRPLVHPILFVHRVAGLAPGLYALGRDADALPALQRAMRADFLWEPVAGAPAHLPLRRLLQADLRLPSRVLCCYQAIAADGAFAVAMLARFDSLFEQGPWWYRRLHWEAGMLGHVLYLEAEAAGVRGTGLGCFMDDETHRLLGLDGSAWQVLYHFAVGSPVEDPRIGSSPPYARLRRDHR